jgi:hypothetical protein
MNKANTLWAIAIALLAVGASLELRFHMGPVLDAPSATAKPLKSVAPTELIQGPRGTVEAHRPAPTNTDTKPLTAAHISNAEQPALDRDFAAAAAKPYVEAYQRQHPMPNAGTYAWNQFQVVFIAAPDSSNSKGYLGVFFPRSESSGAGFTCFKVQDDAQDHLEPLVWGYAPNLAHAIENFRRGAVEGKGCSVPTL